MDRNFRKMALVLMTLSVLCIAAGGVEGERLKLATTTSLQDTGLLDVIKDKFDEKYNVSLDVYPAEPASPSSMVSAATWMS